MSTIEECFITEVKEHVCSTIRSLTCSNEHVCESFNKIFWNAITTRGSASTIIIGPLESNKMDFVTGYFDEFKRTHNIPFKLAIIDGDVVESDTQAVMSLADQLIESTSMANFSANSEAIYDCFRQSFTETKPIIIVINSVETFAKHRKQMFLYLLLDLMQKKDLLFMVVGLTANCFIQTLLEKRITSRLNAAYLYLRPVVRTPDSGVGASVGASRSQNTWDSAETRTAQTCIRLASRLVLPSTHIINRVVSLYTSINASNNISNGDSAEKKHIVEVRDVRERVQELVVQYNRHIVSCFINSDCAFQNGEEAITAVLPKETYTGHAEEATSTGTSTNTNVIRAANEAVVRSLNYEAVLQFLVQKQTQTYTAPPVVSMDMDKDADADTDGGASITADTNADVSIDAVAAAEEELMRKQHKQYDDFSSALLRYVWLNAASGANSATTATTTTTTSSSSINSTSMLHQKHAFDNSNNSSSNCDSGNCSAVCRRKNCGSLQGLVHCCLGWGMGDDFLRCVVHTACYKLRYIGKSSSNISSSYNSISNKHYDADSNSGSASGTSGYRDDADISAVTTDANNICLYLSKELLEECIIDQLDTNAYVPFPSLSVLLSTLTRIELLVLVSVIRLYRTEDTYLGAIPGTVDSIGSNMHPIGGGSGYGVGVGGNINGGGGVGSKCRQGVGYNWSKVYEMFTHQYDILSGSSTGTHSSRDIAYARVVEALQSLVRYKILGVSNTRQQYQQPKGVHDELSTTLTNYSMIYLYIPVFVLRAEFDSDSGTGGRGSALSSSSTSGSTGGGQGAIKIYGDLIDSLDLTTLVREISDQEVQLFGSSNITGSSSHATTTTVPSSNASTSSNGHRQPRKRQKLMVSETIRQSVLQVFVKTTTA